MDTRGVFNLEGLRDEATILLDRKYWPTVIGLADEGPDRFEPGCDHRAILADEDLHRHATENLDRADALLFGRVTYDLMEAGWRQPAQTGARPDWTEPFARTIDAKKKFCTHNAARSRGFLLRPSSPALPLDAGALGRKACTHACSVTR
ncbi:MAG TPA: hypothetical protein VFG35_18790, partial [Actinoplanes sp.]|nr:hypothetical protein [Actinoplanes sp.]